MFLNNELGLKTSKISFVPATGSRSTFEFPSRVNLSGPSLYCTLLYGQDSARLYD